MGEQAPNEWVVDVDSTDDWMDKPRPRYDGKTLDEIAADRDAAGLPPEKVNLRVPGRQGIVEPGSLPGT
jgi:hypothetical protein